MESLASPSLSLTHTSSLELVIKNLLTQAQLLHASYVCEKLTKEQENNHLGGCVRDNSLMNLY